MLKPPNYLEVFFFIPIFIPYQLIITMENINDSITINPTRIEILKRIEEIKLNENGFKKGTMRWDKLKFAFRPDHISEMDFSTIPDPTLIYVFEQIIKQYYSQM